MDLWLAVANLIIAFLLILVFAVTYELTKKLFSNRFCKIFLWESCNIYSLVLKQVTWFEHPIRVSSYASMKLVLIEVVFMMWVIVDVLLASKLFTLKRTNLGWYFYIFWREKGPRLLQNIHFGGICFKAIENFKRGAHWQIKNPLLNKKLKTIKSYFP